MPMHDWTRISPNDYHHFHGRWIFSIADWLNDGALPARYLALAEHAIPPAVPDVLTLELPGGNGAQAQRAAPPDRPNGTGGVATIAGRPATRYTATVRAPRRAGRPQRRIAIRTVDDRRIVAVVEIVSPGNKAGVREFRRFIDKAVGFLRNGIHLLVIDPFPPTLRDKAGLHAAIWRALTREQFNPPPDKPLTLASYAAEGADVYSSYVEPMAVGDNFPEMPLLLEPELFVRVPLETTYQTAWASYPTQLRKILEPHPGPR
jgi:hypothetical protein